MVQERKGHVAGSEIIVMIASGRNKSMQYAAIVTMAHMHHRYNIF